MKKTVIILLLVFLNTNIHAQDNLGTIVNECVSLLDKPVPNYYQRINRTTYRHPNQKIVVCVENGKVSLVAIGDVFKTVNEAIDFNSKFYSFFESNGWIYNDKNYDGEDIYVKNGVYALIGLPGKRVDGYIATAVMLSKNVPLQ